MDAPPVPKPRSGIPSQNDSLKIPIPLPRTKVPKNNDRVSASDILRSISTASKQIGEDVAAKVTCSAKTANEKLEKSIIDGSRFAKDTLEKTMTTSRAVRNSVTKSVLEGTRTAGMLLRKTKKPESTEESSTQRCVSMPAADVSLFDNIQFHSPLLDQKRYNLVEGSGNSTDCVSLQLNNPHYDDMSLFSCNSDSLTDSVSNFSQDSREFEGTSSNFENEQMTYDRPKSFHANSVGGGSCPNIPERRRKTDSQLEVMRQNSLYENWTLPFQTKSETNEPAEVNMSPRPSISTIYEFDPLQETATSTQYQGVSNELILLEAFLTGDTYGTVTEDTHEDSFDFVECDYFNPPTPPERSDSLFPELEQEITTDCDTNKVEAIASKDRNSNWFVHDEDDIKSTVEDEIKPSGSVIQRFSRKLKLDRQKTTKTNVKISEHIERPPVNNLLVPYYSGMLTKIASGVVEDLFKNSQNRYCVLSDKKLMCYTDPTNNVLKEAYLLENIFSLQIVLVSSSTTGNSYCFELSVAPSGVRGAPRKLLFSCSSASERRNWVQKIAEHLSSDFPTKYTSEFTRCGWCYLKEGVTGEWRGAWLLLVRRVLVHSSARDPSLTTIDLRKTRCVATQSADEETKRVCPTDGSGNLLLDCPHATLYLRFPHERELKDWRYMAKLAAHNNGAHLHHQQLTRDDVPVIVDKCLSFIYAHGSLSEGIYRRAGSSSVLAELLARFRRDAWAVQLSAGQHSEHDVAGVLKRFLRDLPSPLLPEQMHKQLLEALDVPEESARWAAYRRSLRALPAVGAATARRLFAHLHFLQSMAHANRMTAENLASVWAPTIMPAALTTDALTSWSSREASVVRELIVQYEAVWRPSAAERMREAAVRRVLTRVLRQPRAVPAGDLRLWVYVHDKTNSCQLALTPNKTCGEACAELSEKAQAEPHRLLLEEVVCGGALRRVLHFDEVLLDVVSRWGYWDPEDRNDSYLVCRDNGALRRLAARGPAAVSGDLRLAAPSTRHFRSHAFHLGAGTLSCYKDKQGAHKIDEWQVKDILWYAGFEPRRNPQAHWAITFIPKNHQTRTKERPWFGHALAGSVSEDQEKWLAALMFAEHAEILPAPRLVIT